MEPNEKKKLGLIENDIKYKFFLTFLFNNAEKSFL